MFFFVFTSQSVGSPFAFDTMLRSGAPPHIGQSPVPGSEAERRTAVPAAITATATLTLRRRGAEKIFFLTREFLCVSASLRRSVNVLVMLFIGSKFQIVDIGAELSIDEKPRRTLPIADRIRLVDLPRRRLGRALRPRFAARAYLPVREVPAAQLDRVP